MGHLKSLAVLVRGWLSPLQELRLVVALDQGGLAVLSDQVSRLALGSATDPVGHRRTHNTYRPPGSLDHRSKQSRSYWMLMCRSCTEARGCRQRRHRCQRTQHWSGLWLAVALDHGGLEVALDQASAATPAMLAVVMEGVWLPPLVSMSAKWESSQVLKKLLTSKRPT